MIKYEKYSLLFIKKVKKHKESNASIILRYTKMPYPPKITNETKSGYNFLYTRERRQKKCTCDNRRSYSKHLFDGDNRHILQLF